MSTNYKADFPLLAQRDVVYLDSAATAQRPQCVLDAEREFYTRHNANPLRGLYPLSIEATEALESARAAVARFLGAAQSEEIVFTRNTTEGLNLVAYSYGLSHVKAGDEILISTMEHHSNILPWQMVCRQTGAQLKFMECEPDGSLDPNKVEALITARTRVVALQQVSNVLGREYPIRAVAELAHRVGAVLVVVMEVFAPYNGVTQFIYNVLYYYVVVNISLAVFNLIPLPPLDGSRIVAAFLSDRAMYTYYRYQNIFVLVMFLLLFSGAMSGPLSTAQNFFARVIFSLAEAPFRLFGAL